MELLDQLDNASCKATSEIDRFIRSRCFTSRSKAVAERHCLSVGFIFPRTLNHLGISNVNAAEQRVEVASSELDFATATKEFDVPARRSAERDVAEHA